MYSVDEKSAPLVRDVVSQIINEIMNKEGINKPFVPFKYIFLTVLNIFASSAFGNRFVNSINVYIINILIIVNILIMFRYSMNDKEFFKIKRAIESFEHNLNPAFASEFIPFSRIFVNKSLKIAQNQFSELLGIAKKRYKNHQNDYQEELIRDLTDGFLSAKIDAINNSKESARYLTDDNLSTMVGGLLIGL